MANSAVTLTAGSGYGSAANTAAIGNATAIAVKMRLRGDALNAATTGYHKILQISATITSGYKFILGIRVETSIGGIVVYDTPGNNVGSPKQLGSVGKAAFDVTKYYIVYVHYDPSSATEKLRATVTLDEGAGGTPLDASSNTLLTAALPAGATMGAVFLHRDFAAVGSKEITVDGLAIYSAILPLADRTTEPSAGDANLLAYWPADEGTGTAIAEISGGNGLTLAGTTTWVAEGTWPASGAASYNATGTGGVAVAGAAAVAATRTATATGGVTVAGTSPVTIAQTAVASGGITVGGTSPAAHGQATVATGGVTVGGTADASVSSATSHSATGAGGVTVTGSATVTRAAMFAASGGVIVAGSAAPARGRAALASGGVHVAGTAVAALVPAVAAYAVTGAGGVHVAGAATTGSAQSAIGTGGVRVAGTAAAQWFRVPFSLVQRERGYTGTGSVGDRATHVPAQGVVVSRVAAVGVIRPQLAGAMGMTKPHGSSGKGGGQGLVDTWLVYGRGGVRVGGSSPVSAYFGAGPATPVYYTVFAEGGVSAGGAAPVTSTSRRTYATHGTGGVAARGSALVAATTPTVAAVRGTGGVVVRGTAPIARVIVPAPGGGGVAFTTPTAPATFDTTRPVFGGATWLPTTFSELQAAVNGAGAGDQILLSPGVDYRGNLQLKPRGLAATEWIEIRTNVPYATIASACPEGKRMTPATATTLNLATLSTPGAGAASVQAMAGAEGYRFTAVNFRLGGDCSAAIYLGNVFMTDATQAAKRLVIDRCVFIGGATFHCNHAVYACAEQAAVVDSWIADVYGVGDTQSILIAGWQGPYVVRNNYLEGWTENLMCGGAETQTPADDIRGVPSDIIIEHNYFTKNMAYRNGAPFGCTEKNIFEMKSGRRVRVRYNIFEHSWPAGQLHAITLKSNDQALQHPLQGTQDMEFSWNWVRFMAHAFNVAANPQNATLNALNRLWVHDNLIEHVNDTANFTGGGMMLQLLGGLANVTFEHNTWVKAIGAGSTLAMEGAAVGPIAVRSNLLHLEGYGMHATGKASGTPSWESFVPNPGDRVWSNMIAVGLASATGYPAGTTALPTGDAAVGYADLAAGDYRVTGPLATAAHDGGPVGISDTIAFMANLATVITGG